MAKPNLQAALGEIRNMSRAFRAFSEVENTLLVLENLDAVTSERKQAADAALAEAKTATAELTAAKEALATARAAAAKVEADAKTDAAQLLTAAREKADEIKAAADTHAEQLSGTVRTLGAEIEKLTTERDALEKRLGVLRPAVERAERIAAATAV